MKHFFPVVAAGVLGVLTSGAHGEELRNMTLGNARPPCAHRVRAGDTVRARVRLAALVGDMGRKTEASLREQQTWEAFWASQSREARALRDVVGHSWIESDWRTVHDSGLGPEEFTAANETYGYDGTVIRGLAYGVVGMCAGDTRVVYLPPRLAFGPAPIDDIPGNVAVVANVTLESRREPRNAPKMTDAERFLARREDYQLWQQEHLKEIRGISDGESHEMEMDVVSQISSFEPFRVRAGRNVTLRFLARGVTPGDSVLLARRGVACGDAFASGEAQRVVISERKVTVTLPRGIFYACFQSVNVPQGWDHVWKSFPNAIVKSF